MTTSVIHLLVIILFIFTNVNALSVQKVNSCSNTTIQVRSDLCSGDPCQLKRGSNGIIEVDFEARDDSNDMTAEVTIRIGSIDVPFPGFDRNACNIHGFECPVKKSNKYTYSYDLQVLPEYPKLNSQLKWSINDANGYADVCFTMSVSIVD